MSIRKLKQKKIVNTKIISLFIILCVGTYILIRFLTSLVDRFNQDPQDTMLYTLGATLTFSGKMAVDNAFPHYTHSLVSYDGNKIGLKSTSINLNAYTDSHIELVGSVKKYHKVTPVLDVHTIKFPDQGLILKDNRYFFVDDLLYLDFSTQPQLSAIKSGSAILVMYDDTIVVDIERFACSKILKTRDCTALITSYIQGQKDTFESYPGYVFYKHDAGYRTTFDANNYGFLFKNVADDMILDISSMFFMVNKKFIVDNKMDLISEYCKDDFSQISSIDIQGPITYTSPYTIKADFVGTDTKRQSVSCSISFDVWNDWEVVDYQYN